MSDSNKKKGSVTILGALAGLNMLTCSHQEASLGFGFQGFRTTNFAECALWDDSCDQLANLPSTFLPKA